GRPNSHALEGAVFGFFTNKWRHHAIPRLPIMAIPISTLWPLEPHTLGKHRVLKSYLDAWFPILGRTSDRILFIDGFAGPGQYEGGEEGSPIIALRSLIEHTAGGRIPAEVRFVFIDSEKDRKDHLDT